MQILIRLLRAAFLIFAFCVLFGFAIKNDGLVTVHAFFDADWQVPLVVVMLLMFVAGVLLGVTAIAGTAFMLRREVSRLRKLAPVVSPSTRLRGRSGDPQDSV